MQPHLKEWRRKNCELVLVSSDSPQELNKFLKKNGLSVSVLLDREFKVGKLYRVRGIPTDFLINEQGIIEHSFVGWSEKSLAKMEYWVAEKS